MPQSKGQTVTVPHYATRYRAKVSKYRRVVCKNAGKITISAAGEGRGGQQGDNNYFTTDN